MSFKIYANFESVLKEVQRDNRDSNDSYARKNQKHIPRSFAFKVMYTDDRFCKPIVLYIAKLAINRFIKEILNEYNYCKSMMKKHFNKKLVMTVADEKSSKSSDKCWICNGLFAEEDNKAKDHDHVTGSYRGSVHWDYNINLKLTKKIFVIIHNLRGYDSHLIIQEISKFDLKQVLYQTD